MAVTLEELRDREEIRDVLTRYWTAIDARRPDLMPGCFTEDVIAVYEGVTVAANHAELMDFLSGKGRTASIALVDVQRTTHMIGNLTYDIRGDEAETEVTCLAHLIDKPEGRLRMVTRGLRYRDLLRRTAEGWKIARREHILDWSRDDALTYVAPL